MAALLADAAAATAAASAAASAASATPTVPLHGAASSQRALRTSIVKLLCAAPGAAAALALQDLLGRTALYQAVYNNHHSIVELLCAAPGAGAALALRDHQGRTPLALAVARGLAACAAVLRARGAPE